MFEIDSNVLRECGKVEAGRARGAALARPARLLTICYFFIGVHVEDFLYLRVQFRPAGGRGDVAGGRGRLQFAALEFDSAGKEEAKRREQGAGFLWGKVFQVGGIQGGGGVLDDFLQAAQASFAGFGFTGGLESSLFFAGGLIVGKGAFYPVPFVVPIASSLRRVTLAVRPSAIGSREGAGRP